MPASFADRRLVDDAVGMHDLRNAVVHLQRAGDVALLADRQQLLDIAGLGAEERQHDVAGVVAGIDEVGRARNCAARGGRWRSTVTSSVTMVPCTASRIFGRARRSITLARQMQQQIDQPRRLIAAEQIAQQLVLLRPDAGKARDRRKQRIEQGGAHAGDLRSVFMPSCPGLSRASTSFVLCASRRGWPASSAGHDEHLSSNTETRADIGDPDGYINPARHVRAFGVRMELGQ